MSDHRSRGHEAHTTVLELRRGGTPFPHGGPTGEWRYRHAVAASGPTPLDRQAVADFFSYEHAHGRGVAVVADDDLADWPAWSPPITRPAPDSSPSQCCTHAYKDGCGVNLVCHGAPLASAIRVAETATLLPATLAYGRSADQLAQASSWGEPPDYFEHVMFANGRCTAPEAVAHSRTLQRDLVPTDLLPGYPPAVRFYFRWDDLVSSPAARFDGVHPIKTLGTVALHELLVAIVVHEEQSPALLERTHPGLRDRVAVVALPAPTPQDWATAASAAAQRMDRGR